MLHALESQSFPMDDAEVIICMDHCTDGTGAFLQQYAGKLRLETVSLKEGKAAAARNAGAARASGQILIFLDDDIEPLAGTISAHVDAHTGSASQVVVGYLPPRLNGQKGFFQVKLRTWWEDMFEPMRQPGHIYTYRNFLSGNFSITQELFHRSSGFDETFFCQEDYEFAYRLLRMGATMQFSDHALALHHEITDLKRSLKRKFDEGRIAVRFMQLYPELIPTIPVIGAYHKEKHIRTLVWRAFHHPGMLALQAALTEKELGVLEKAKLRGRWQRRLDNLLTYWFVKGLAAAGLSHEEVVALLMQPMPSKAPCLDIDLTKGLKTCREILDREKPFAVNIWLGEQLAGTYGNPGSAPITGVHLEKLIADAYRKNHNLAGWQLIPANAQSAPLETVETLMP